MKRVLFIGDITKNNGPSNVNKELYTKLSNDFYFVKEGKSILFLLKCLFFIPFCKCIIFSGILKVDKVLLPISLFFKKKIIYIMHGCVFYEAVEVNHVSTLGGDIIEKKLWDYSDLILCVSEPFAEWFQNYRPMYAKKVQVLANSIQDELLNKKSVSSKNKENVIILLGMGRRTKNNIKVVEAVKNINQQKKMNIKIKVYGNARDNDDSNSIINHEFVENCGSVSKEELFTSFQKSRLFIQNSTFEPFSLAVVESLTNGCDILISKFVGAKSILDYHNEDIIEDPNDVKEIENKILNFFENNMTNHARLLKSIDKKKCNTDYAADLLKSYVSLVGSGRM